ncbi:MAG: SH3 domain-containing protein [Clostridia bacterium]|nr:SH3 domain-containing protein [Clostridia bacterium]
MKFRLGTISLALSVVLIIVMLFSGLTAFAYEVEELDKKGVIATNSDNLNIRSGPGTSFGKVGSVAKGSVVDVIGTVTNENSEVWYKISANGIVGFGLSTYITLIEIPELSDEDFETAILAFPESYHEKLRTLHALHPTWRFTALKTTMTWDTLLKNQWVIGRNLLQSPEAWKSFEDGAYNWSASSWYSFDSGNWNQACKEVIEYYLDPRNFLDGNVYQFLVLSNDGSKTDPEVINGILKNTFMHNKDAGDGMTYAEAIVKAAEEAGASPYMLAARIKMEQGAKGNKLAHGTVSGYEGYYNHFDIGAYAHSGRSAILNGAIYAKNKGWNSVYKAILGGANFLVKNYIGVGQNTLYLQKYDVVDGGNGYYNHQYMTNVSAAVSECETLRSAISGTLAEESALNFLIPVYENMPEKTASLPLRTGNANNLLSALSVKDEELTEEFDMYKFEYELFVEGKTINISATAKNSAAKVEGIGEIELKYQTNKIPVTVTATNGLKRVYMLYVTTTADLPKEPDPTPTPTPTAKPTVKPTPEGQTPSASPSTTPTVTPTATPTLTPTPTPVPKEFSTEFTVSDDLILGIGAGSTVAQLDGKITVQGYTVEYFDASGSKKTATQTVKTGDKICLIYDSKVEKTYYAVIFGDSNGDGKLNVADLIITQKQILGLSNITNAARKRAMDFNSDNKTNVADLILCQKRILGLG